MRVSDRALNRLKAQAAGLLAPAEIQRIRKKLHLTQKQAGQLIGGGPNAFQKYENGDVLASRALSNLMRVLDHEPGLLGVLEGEAGSRTAA